MRTRGQRVGSSIESAWSVHNVDIFESCPIHAGPPAGMLGRRVRGLQYGSDCSVVSDDGNGVTVEVGVKPSECLYNSQHSNAVVTLGICQ